MSQLTLHLLGPPRLELDGTPVHISYRKAMALFTYLATTGQPHTRDSLATLLWPENDQSSARAGLRRMLSILNQALGSGWLQADRETVNLDTHYDPLEGKTFGLDVAEFQGQIKIYESHNHSETEICPDCLPALEEAVALYSADFMAGFSLKDCPAYDEWQFFQTEELRTQLSNALERLSSHFTALKDFEPAIQHARRWLSIDPIHEPAHQQLMTIYEASGQRSAALRQYDTCQQVLFEELGVEPSQETQDLYQGIKTRTLISLPDPFPKSNLPAQPTPFIGREIELAEIREKLKQSDCRLLTLLGPGGSGKTRLAIQTAEGLLEDFRQGVFFVNLAQLEDISNIPSTIASALNFSFSEGGAPEEQLLGYLRNKEMLLIMDNFEHLVQGAKIVNQIVIFTASVKILATSRTSLAITSEHLYEVMGMAYPETHTSDLNTSSQYSAVRLFESGARRRQSAFELTAVNIPDVIRVCSLVEGMPLGIVLAASWIELLTPTEIASEIYRDLEFLETELSDLPQRQRSLRSVFNHSWRLLSESERALMPALSVFRGGFTQEAAQKIASASLGNLLRLTQKSILYRKPDGRFEIHELLRQYAAEKLTQNSTYQEDILKKHSDYYCQALAVWERDLQNPTQAAAIKEMRVEIDNIRAAWAWALDNGKIKILLNAINGLGIFLLKERRRLELVETCQFLADKLEIAEQPKPGSLGIDETYQVDRLKLQARALAWGCGLSAILGYHDLYQQLFQRCLSTLERRELDEEDIRFEKAHAYLSSPHLAAEGLHLFRSLDETGWVGFALIKLGTLAASIDERITYYKESLAAFRKTGDLWWMGHALGSLARDHTLLGYFGTAEIYVFEALDSWMTLEDREGLVATYGILGMNLVCQGKFNEAQSLVGEILAETTNLGYAQSRAAWFHVISGLPDLYLGKYEAAREKARNALELLKEVNRTAVPYWTAIANDILGKAALAERSYAEAHKLFKTYISLYRSRNLPENIDQALASLGSAARGLRQLSQAKNYSYHAMEISIREKEFLTLIHTLPGIALLFADQDKIERAVELYALASTQGIVANSKWFADIAGDEIAAASAKLPPEVIEAAKARGRARDLWETAEELLEELEALGWNTKNIDMGVE